MEDPRQIQRAETIGPSAEQCQPSFTRPVRPSGAGLFVAIAAFILGISATAISVAALIVATKQSPASNQAVASTAPSFTSAEASAAHQQLCETYRLAARAVQIETNGKNSDRANLATANGAGMLQGAIIANPALPVGERMAALGLAESYGKVAALTSVVSGADDPTWQTALTDANAKDAVMQKACGGP